MTDQEAIAKIRKHLYRNGPATQWTVGDLVVIAEIVKAAND